MYLIEKYEDPAGDGNQSRVGSNKHPYTLRNTKTPQGTETPQAFFYTASWHRIEKYEDPAGDGNMVSIQPSQTTKAD